MVRELYLQNFLGETRLAVLEDGRLCEYAVERADSMQLGGNIYKGTVRDVLPGLNAAFVEIGLAKNGYLSMEDIAVGQGDITPELREEMLRQHSRIKRGQEVIVQISKETTGEKGPRLTGNISLPGTLAVYLPTLPYIGISRKITDKKERDRLTSIAREHKGAESGVILRTAANGKSEEEVAAEMDALRAKWARICAKAEYARTPLLLHSENTLLDCAIRDLMNDDTVCFVTDEPAAYERALQLAPAMADRISLAPNGSYLFEEHKIDRLVGKAFERTVRLPCGGSIVIDYTEALTAIDVNSGACAAEHTLADTILRANCEAAEEIARQLRLRDIGGLIVIDFIDIARPGDKKTVMDALKKALAQDRANTRVLPFSDLGLVEMTRRKFRPSLFRALQGECSACGGTGWRMTPQSAAREALRQCGYRLSKGESPLFLISASQAVCEQLIALRRSFPVNAYVVPDKNRSGGEYTISPCAENELPRNGTFLGKEK